MCIQCIMKDTATTAFGACVALGLFKLFTRTTTTEVMTVKTPEVVKPNANVVVSTTTPVKSVRYVMIDNKPVKAPKFHVLAPHGVCGLCNAGEQEYSLGVYMNRDEHFTRYSGMNAITYNEGNKIVIVYFCGSCRNDIFKPLKHINELEVARSSLPCTVTNKVMNLMSMLITND